MAYYDDIGPIAKLNTNAAAFNATRRTLLGSKLVVFCLRITSSRRGCCHLPGVETAGEAAFGELGTGAVAVLLVGVKLNLGSGMASLALTADVFVAAARVFVDWTSAVEDMVAVAVGRDSGVLWGVAVWLVS